MILFLVKLVLDFHYGLYSSQEAQKGTAEQARGFDTATDETVSTKVKF